MDVRRSDDDLIQGKIIQLRNATGFPPASE